MGSIRATSAATTALADGVNAEALIIGGGYRQLVRARELVFSLKVETFDASFSTEHGVGLRDVSWSALTDVQLTRTSKIPAHLNLARQCCSTRGGRQRFMLRERNHFQDRALARSNPNLMAA